MTKFQNHNDSSFQQVEHPLQRGFVRVGQSCRNAKADGASWRRTLESRCDTNSASLRSTCEISDSSGAPGASVRYIILPEPARSMPHPWSQCETSDSFGACTETCPPPRTGASVRTSLTSLEPATTYLLRCRPLPIPPVPCGARFSV